MKKVGIYVQVPFCQTKCTYCNFHTGVVASSRFAPYVEAVCGEIRRHRELLTVAGVDWPGRLGRSGAAPLQNENGIRGEQLAVDTVYIGGGAPAVVGFGWLRRSLLITRRIFPRRVLVASRAG